MISRFQKRNRRGFTFTELILVVGMIVILAAVSVPVLQSFQVGNDLSVSVNVITQTLRRAQSLSQSMVSDTSWGVSIQSGAIILFKGTSYSLRDPSFDEIFDMPKSITPSGVGEIVFSKFSGEPQVTGDIILTTPNQLKTISINKKGILTY